MYNTKGSGDTNPESKRFETYKNPKLSKLNNFSKKISKGSNFDNFQGRDILTNWVFYNGGIVLIGWNFFNGRG